jgi:hypothetical protein
MSIPWLIIWFFEKLSPVVICLLDVIIREEYHDVVLSIFASSVERWTGFGEMQSSAASQPNKQESTEGHRGKLLSCGNNYFHKNGTL